MPYTGRDWDNVDPTSELPYTYDFSNRIPDSDSITAVTWTMECTPNNQYTVIDPSPNSYFGNSSASQFEVTMWIGPGLVGNTRYKLIASITTQSGIKDDLFSYINCDPTP